MTAHGKWVFLIGIIGFSAADRIPFALSDEPAGREPGKASKVVAKVNSTTITLEEFNKKYQENLKFFPYKAPTKDNFLKDLIKREAGIQEAKRQGLDKDSEIQERQNTVLYHALLEKNLSKDFEKIHITDDQAKAFYSKNPELRTSHVFIAVPPGADAAAQKKAYERIKQINDDHISKGKMTFADVAQRFSEGPAAPMGGDIDYQTKDRLDPLYYETALKLGKPGKVSGIIRTQFGYHIIKLTAIRSWDEVDKTQVKRMVFEEQRANIFDKYMNGLVDRASVSVHKELIKN